MNTKDLLKIPAFPPVAAKLLQAAANDNTGAADLVHLLRSDPALSAQIIRHANSPLFNLMSEVKALDHAVALLGIQKIRMLALSAISRTYVRATAMVDTLRTFWRYSLSCALLAERIARPARVQEDTAYGAALLHDIGRLGLMMAHPNEYPKLLEAAAADLAAGVEFDLLGRERALFGIDRYEAGEWLARTWNLPQEFREAAGKYDLRMGEGVSDLTAVVMWACRIANSLGYAVLDNPRKPSYEEILQALPASLAAQLPARAEDLVAHIEAEIAALDSNGGSSDEESAKRAVAAARGNAQEDDETYEQSERDHCEPLSRARPRRRWNLWPVFVAGAAVLLITALVFVKLTTGHWPC